MRRSNRFVPSAESLERLSLLTAANIASFVQPIVLDTTDTTNHTAFGFPGMEFTVQVNCPSSYGSSTSQIEYVFTELLDTANTTYSTTLGNYKSLSSVTRGPGGLQDQMSFGLPKTPGTVTISISADVKDQYGSSTTLTDTLKVTVEAPTATLTVADAAGPTTPAGPLAFDTASGTGGSTNFDPHGDRIGFMMGAGGPLLQRDSAGMWATVNNTTHYDLTMGFIQIVNSYNVSRTYTDGSSFPTSGSNFLDMTSSQTGVFYKGFKGTFQTGASSSMPVNSTVDDSPRFTPLARIAISGTDYWLKAMSMSIQFSTSVVVWGGYMPNSYPNGPSIPGYPIALSTAQWHMYGNATNATNTNDPGGASSATTLNANMWSTQLGIGSGPLPTGSNLPGPDNQWTAPGDGAPKYLTWTSNSQTVLTSGGVSDSASLGEQTDSGRWAHAAVAAPQAAWDRALNLLASTAIAPTDTARGLSLAPWPTPYHKKGKGSVS